MIKLLQNKKNLWLKYAVIGGWVLLLYFIKYFVSECPLTLLLTLSTLVLVPGFGLARIFKIKISSDFLDQLVLYFTIGFSFVLMIGFLGIVFGLTISNLTMLCLVLIGLIYFLALVLDLIYSKSEDFWQFNFKELFCTDNLGLILVWLVSILTILILVKQGSLTHGGDPNYHLSILRKVISGQPLTVNNLSYTPTNTSIAYMFPIWHVFLGILAKITQANMFAIWKDITVVMMVPIFVVWFWICKKIFVLRSLSALAFICFVALTFYWGNGWLYTTLPIPHSLSQLLLLPLSIGLAFAFIISLEKTNYKLGIILSIFVLLSGAIHLTGYFYYLLVLVSLLFCYAFLKFKEQNFWRTLWRIVFLACFGLIVILPLALGLELKSHLITAFLKEFGTSNYPTSVRYGSFTDYNVYSKYAYIFLASLLFFVRRYRNLLLILAVSAAAPIFCSSILIKPMTRILGHITMNRFFATLEWHFLVWALVIGFILVLVDRLVSLIKQKDSYWEHVVNAILAAFAFFLVLSDEQLQVANTINDSFQSDQVLGFLDKYHWGLIGLIVLTAIVCYFKAKKQPKINDFFVFAEPKNHLTWFMLVFIVGFILFSPNNKSVNIALGGNYSQYLIQPTAETATTMAEKYAKTAGGLEEIDFINKNLPANSIFATNIGYFYLPIVVDQHMPLYNSYAAKQLAPIFDDNLQISAKISLMKTYKIDYLLVKQDDTMIGTYFDQYPQYFTQIFKDNNFVYRVNKENL